MQTIKEIVKDLIDNVRTGGPSCRIFLDKSKDLSIYDVDNPRLPIVNKTIIVEKTKKIGVKIRGTKKKIRE